MNPAGLKLVDEVALSIPHAVEKTVSKDTLFRLRLRDVSRAISQPGPSATLHPCQNLPENILKVFRLIGRIRRYAPSQCQCFGKAGFRHQRTEFQYFTLV